MVNVSAHVFCRSKLAGGLSSDETVLFIIVLEKMFSLFFKCCKIPDSNTLLAGLSIFVELAGELAAVQVKELGQSEEQ